MLVEDDNNLREIYEARLAAEGYEIISAADGEAALALAIKEKPDLIISDIMMPKVSGFDMLDILRSTTETKNTKIIMMTALNQAEDKAKAEKLGADLYLVKSQVTLEDVVRSAKGLLGEETPLSVGGVPVQTPVPTSKPITNTTTSLSANAPTIATPTPAATMQPAPQPAPAVAAVTTAPIPPQVSTSTAPSQPAPVPTTPPTPVATSNKVEEMPITANTTEDEEAALQKQIEQYISDDSAKVPDSTAPIPTAISQQPTNTPSPSTMASTPTPQPVPVPVPAATVETQAPIAQPVPAPTVTPQAVPIPEVPSVPVTPSSMAQPPSSLEANTPAAGDPNADRPAGEQILVKSASADTTTTEPGIDASVSGRKKVIEPINDVFAKGPDLAALADREGDGTTPEMNTVITPEGTTLSATNGTPTMNDVIAPNPTQATQDITPQQPLPPPVA